MDVKCPQEAPLTNILRSISDLDDDQWRDLFDGFDAPIVSLDCGGKCRVHNPSGKPFCCDIDHAVPAAYTGEWTYYQRHTDLWHRLRRDESRSEPAGNLPDGMLLLACLGPDRCRREYRALSCRQFPFFPYVTADYRFVGMACEWEFEDRCWVVSHLPRVSQAYRTRFIQVHDRLFAHFQDIFDNYAVHSEWMRAVYARKRRRFPLLHRNGGYYLVSPRSGRFSKVDPSRLGRFGFYRG